MKRINCLLLLLSLFCLSGCLWFGRTAIRPVKVADDVSVEVIREDLWVSGGALVFVPFTPGLNAEAGQMVDRLSLMMVKGASDFFDGNNGGFRLVTEGDVDQARFVIEGRIEEFDTGSKWKSIGIGKKNVTLKVKGELRERKTGEVVALIFGFKSFKKIKDSDQMAYDLGRSIGEKVQH